VEDAGNLVKPNSKVPLQIQPVKSPPRHCWIGKNLVPCAEWLVAGGNQTLALVALGWLASGTKNGGAYERVWYHEPIGAEEVAFESSVFLLSKAKAQQLKSHRDAPRPETPTEPEPAPDPTLHHGPGEGPPPQPATDESKRATLRLIGDVPPEIWNRLGTKILPKLRSGDGLRVGIEFSVSVETAVASNMEKEIQLILKELGLDQRVRVERV
jgi:hypothetical protein